MRSEREKRKKNHASRLVLPCSAKCGLGKKITNLLFSSFARRIASSPKCAQEEKTAVLMATHDMTMVEKFPGRVMRVENGKIKEISTINRFNPFTPFDGKD